MSGVPLQVSPSFLLFFTDASMFGYGAYLLDLTESGVWSWEKKSLHINVLEMKAIQLPLAAFCNCLTGEPVVIMGDTATMVAYLQNEDVWSLGSSLTLLWSLSSDQSFTR